MTLTDFFFYIATGVTGLFAICVLILLICYLTIYERVNKNFRAVKK